LSDLVLKEILVNLVLGLKCKNTVLDSFSGFLRLVAINTRLFSIINDVGDFITESKVDSMLVLELLSHNINIFTEVTVAALQIVELDESFVELVLLKTNVSLVMVHLGS